MLLGSQLLDAFHTILLDIRWGCPASSFQVRPTSDDTKLRHESSATSCIFNTLSPEWSQPRVRLPFPFLRFSFLLQTSCCACRSDCHAWHPPRPADHWRRVLGRGLPAESDVKTPFFWIHVAFLGCTYRGDEIASDLHFFFARSIEKFAFCPREYFESLGFCIIYFDLNFIIFSHIEIAFLL